MVVILATVLSGRKEQLFSPYANRMQSQTFPFGGNGYCRISSVLLCCASSVAHVHGATRLPPPRTVKFHLREGLKREAGTEGPTPHNRRARLAEPRSSAEPRDDRSVQGKQRHSKKDGR
ncbi:hypothetical protein DPEC_G00309340 [Dallia pectoralis]|uniref:Uncharacterized protein n=1 Tax=Dallia pectoralis TaxID=75939 RepID=A0ACC2FEV6_DALPE|nr:hypothetical protein DPEC_G00309340 [Dallia pectoralis]